MAGRRMVGDGLDIQQDLLVQGGQRRAPVRRDMRRYTHLG